MGQVVSRYTKLKLLIQWNKKKKKEEKFLASRIIKKIIPNIHDRRVIYNSSRIQFMILINHAQQFFFFCAIQDSRDDPIKSEWNFSTLSRDISDINNPRIRGKKPQSHHSRVIWRLDISKKIPISRLSINEQTAIESKTKLWCGYEM